MLVQLMFDKVRAGWPPQKLSQCAANMKWNIACVGSIVSKCSSAQCASSASPSWTVKCLGSLVYTFIKCLAKSVHFSDHIGDRELCMLILIASSTAALVPLVYCTLYYCRRRLRPSCGSQEENTNIRIEYESVHMHMELTPMLVEAVVPNLK